jgi:hypothetical protein
VTEVEASPGRVVARVEWADGHAMVFDTHSRSTENDALDDIRDSLRKLRNQQWGIKE